MIASIFRVCILASLLVACLCTTGVDVSQRTYTESFSCMKSYGYKFAIVRVYRSNGEVDTNGPYTIKDAWAGGMSHVDGYIFPCYFCGNAAGQIDATVNYLKSVGVSILKHNETREALIAEYGADKVGATVGMLWLDIEAEDYWSTNHNSNINFISELIKETNARGYSVGIYASSYYWGLITGNYAGFSKYPLWYAHYDNVISFSDFKSFGGWTKPAIKQYAGDEYFCNAGVDKNYYP